MLDLADHPISVSRRVAGIARNDRPGVTLEAAKVVGNSKLASPAWPWRAGRPRPLIKMVTAGTHDASR